MLRGGRGWSPRSPSTCERGPSTWQTRSRHLSALFPVQAWRLSARDILEVTWSHGSECAHACSVQCHAHPYAQTAPAPADTATTATTTAAGTRQRGSRDSGPRAHMTGRAGRSDHYSDDGHRSGSRGGNSVAAFQPGQQPAQDRSAAGAAEFNTSAESSWGGGGTAGTDSGPRDSGFRPRSAWISAADGGLGRRRGARSRGAPVAAAAARPLPAALSDERVVPLMRKAERDLLPGDEPNTPWRRIAYQLRLAPSVSDLLVLYKTHRDSGPVWRPHLTALALTRTGALLYPRAVAAVAASTAQADRRTDGTGRFPPASLKRDVTSLLESLSTKVNKLAIRQVQGMHLARLLVSMAWVEAAGDKCDVLAAALVSELQRQRSGKLCQVALVDPPLFGRLVRALAQLAPANRDLWVDLQRITLAALLEARAEAQAQVQAGPTGPQGMRRIWAGPGRDTAAAATASPTAPPLPKPDCSTADLANMAFGFAAANAASPQLFAALRAAVLSREQPADPDTLARLLCAWGRARLPPGPLPYRVVNAFLPLLDTAAPRPIGRVLWSLGMMGVRDERFLRAAARAIVGRRLVFSSPQELVNVVWAYSQLGWQVEEGAEPLRPEASAWVEAEMRAARSRPRGVLRRAPARLGEAGAEGERFAGSDGPRDERTALAEGQQQSEEAAANGCGRLEDGWMHFRGSISSINTCSSSISMYGRSSSSSSSGLGGAGSNDGTAAGDGGEAAATTGAVRAEGLPPLRPLPLTAPLAAAEQARQAAQQPPPDYPEHFALYRYLGRCFIHRAIGSVSTGAGGGSGGASGGGAAHHIISHSQLAAMVGSFARAGYRSKQLFYTTARIALLRLQFLSPGDLTLVLAAHARLRIPHTGLFEAACPLVAARCCEFTPAQLAEVLWAVQALMPEAYVQLSSAVRTRRGWLPPPRSAVIPAALPEGSTLEDEEEGAAEDVRSEAGVMGRGRGAAELERRCSGGDGDTSAQDREGALLPSLMRLRVPRELLEDSDWIDADEEGEGQEALRDGSMWGVQLRSMDEGESWGSADGGGVSGTANEQRLWIGRAGYEESMAAEMTMRR